MGDGNALYKCEAYKSGILLSNISEMSHNLGPIEYMLSVNIKQMKRHDKIL